MMAPSPVAACSPGTPVTQTLAAVAPRGHAARCRPEPGRRHPGGRPPRPVDGDEQPALQKQSAAQLVEHRVRRGCVERRPQPTDARARLLALTTRGWACTEAAQAAAGETVDT